MGEKRRSSFTTVQFKGILLSSDAKNIVSLLKLAIARSPVASDCKLKYRSGLHRKLLTTECHQCGTEVQVLMEDRFGKYYSYECHSCGSSERMRGQ